MRLRFVETPAWSRTSCSHGDLNERVISCNVAIRKHSSLFYDAPAAFSLLFHCETKAEVVRWPFIMSLCLTAGCAALLGPIAEGESAENDDLCPSQSKQVSLVYWILPIYSGRSEVSLEVGLECMSAVAT